MNDIEKSVLLSRGLIKLLDELLSATDWDSSLFLKVTSKQFIDLKAQAEQILEKALAVTEVTGGVTDQVLLQKGQVEVFVLIYQAGGVDMRKWRDTLKGLASGSVGRPIYRREADAEKAVREHGSLPQEGYVSVYVNKTAIIGLSEDKMQHDRLGNELITLRARAINADNIHEFVHANQNRYFLKEGELVLK